MKTLLTVTATMTIWIGMTFAAPQTWSGQISDAMCGSDHTMMQNGSKKMSEKDCTAACVKAGQKYVLVSNGKVLKIANQNFAGLAANAGTPVNVTGEASSDGKSVTVSKIEPAKK